MAISITDTVTVNRLFQEHAGLIQNDVSKSVTNSNFYFANLNKSEWRDGEGATYQYPIYERVLPDGPVVFEDIGAAENPSSTGGDCSYPVQTISSFGVSNASVTRKATSINGPKICLDTIRTAWQLEAQIANVTRVLAEITRNVWAMEYQSAYTAACGHKIVYDETAASQFDNGTYDAVEATSDLTWDMLLAIHEQLGYVGGDINSFGKAEDGSPVYAVLGDRYDFERLKMDDSNVRSDLRFSTEADSLLGAPGLSSRRSYKGFHFESMQWTPRYDFVNGAYVQRAPWVAVNNVSHPVGGVSWEPNPLYKNAAFTETVIFHKDVLTILVPKLISTGNWQFTQSTWTGAFKWLNIQSEDKNPDGNIGFFRALFGYAPQIFRPDLGFTIMHRRCPTSIRVKTCGVS